MHVWRAAQPQQYEIYFVRLQDYLACIPLLPADQDVLLDFTALFTRCHAAVQYDLDVDYTQLPPIALAATDLVWLDTWLRAQRRRV